MKFVNGGVETVYNSNGWHQPYRRDSIKSLNARINTIEDYEFRLNTTVWIE
jgi:hypothetical protein